MPSTSVIVTEESPSSSHVPYMSVAVPMRKLENSSTIARSPKKRRLNTAAEVSTAVMKEWDVLDVITSVKASRLTPQVENTQEVLMKAI